MFQINVGVNKYAIRIFKRLLELFLSQKTKKKSFQKSDTFGKLILSRCLLFFQNKYQIKLIAFRNNVFLFGFKEPRNIRNFL